MKVLFLEYNSIFFFFSFFFFLIFSYLFLIFFFNPSKIWPGKSKCVRMWFQSFWRRAFNIWYSILFSGYSIFDIRFRN
uniref:NADH dehydrogenase subunit 3 n=1 Tax=Ceramothamnion japonicum TaxID=218448 RepID=A0A0E3DBR5_CERJP|nr:NADH dehydrogenase subunit 3 [Ceramium japonicum]